MSYTLINFNIPNYLKNDFDNIIKFKRTSRTSVLNFMIENFCSEELIKIKERGLLEQLLFHSEQNKSSNKSLVNSSTRSSLYEPLTIPTTNDFF